MASKKQQQAKQQQFKQTQQNKSDVAKLASGGVCRLFIDPASCGTSASGWALFRGKSYSASGTVDVKDRKVSVFERLAQLYDSYTFVSAIHDLKEVHIEQLFSPVHRFTLWSVGVLGTACWTRGVKVVDDLSIKAWQKHVDWKGERKALAPYFEQAASEDELAAIGMAIWYTNTKHEVLSMKKKRKGKKRKRRISRRKVLK